MKYIQYRIQYTGAFYPGGIVAQEPEEEIVGFRCRNINSGYAKALKHALQPVGGEVREIGKIEFWQVDREAALTRVFGEPGSVTKIELDPELQVELEYTPSDDMAEAWAKYQRGQHIEPWELRKLDEERADWRESILG